MIFQTAVKKYVDMLEKNESGHFLAFIYKFQKNDQKKFGTKNAKINFGLKSSIK